MHYKKLFPFSLLLLLTLFTSCKNNDDSKEEANKTNRWIETNMRHWYYWYDEIPAKSNLNFNATPESFFNSLLISKDGKNGYHYSSINKKNTTTRSTDNEPTFGFEFQNWKINRDNTGNNFYYAVNILYVLPNSPAENAGLKRGDWIFKIDGVNVNTTNIYDLLGTKSISLSVSDKYNDANSNARQMSLTPRVVEDNPIFYTDVFQDESTANKKVGYLVYNHFTSGEDEDDKYDLELQEAFKEFKSQGVEEFVLDLRYNGGGIVTSAQLLGELLAPESAIGKVFCETRYNSNVNRTTTYQFERKSGNLNLSRLYILTSSRTASASEAIINGLRPFYDVFLIGEQTEGKNVGSVTLTDDNYEYELHPIVCQIYNAKGESNYVNGFSSDWKWGNNERPSLINGHIELGDKDNDILLKNALQMMTTGAVATRSMAEPTINATPLYNSLINKNNVGVKLPLF